MINAARQIPDQVLARLCPGNVKRMYASLELQKVGAAITLDDCVVSGAEAKHVDVIACAALQCVIARSAIERVVACPAIEGIIASAAIEHVVACAAIKGVIARAAIKRVVAAITVDFIIRIVSREDIVRLVTANGNVRSRQRQVFDVWFIIDRISYRRNNGVRAFVRIFNDDISGIIDIISVVSSATNHRVRAETAIERVISGIANQLVIGLIADKTIVARAANRVLDQRPQILDTGCWINVKIVIGDIARNNRGAVAMRQQGSKRTPVSRAKVNLQICREIRQVISVVSAAIPKIREDARQDRRALPDAIDGFFACDRIPRVSGVLGMRCEIGAINILYRADIIEPKGLKIIVHRCVATNHIVAAKHNGIFAPLVVKGHRA